MAVTGAEESLRTIATFGDAGQAAIQRLSDRFGAAGAAVDSLGQRLTARQREIQALGEALDQVERDRGGTGFVSGTGRDPNAEAQAYVQAERAKQDAVRQTAATEREAADAQAQLRQAAEGVRQSLDPMLAFQLRAAEITDLQVAGTLREVEALNALAQAYARVPSQGVAGPSVPQVTAALPSGIQDYGDAVRMVGQLAQTSLQAEQAAHDLAAAYEIDAGAAGRFAASLAASEEALRRTTEAELAAANAAAQRAAASRPDLADYGAASRQIGQQYQAPGGQVVDPGAATGYLVDERAKVQALTAAREAETAAKRADAAASEQAAQEGAKLVAVLDRMRGATSPLAEAERQLAADTKALAAAGVDAAEVEQYRTLVLGRARDAQRAIDQELEGSGRGYRNISYVIGNLGNQVGDFFVQIAGGTGAIRALTQQLPQAAGAFSLLNSSFAAYAPLAGAAIAVGGVLAQTFLTAGSSSKTAAEAAKEHANALDGLIQKFGLAKGDAAEFAEGLTRLSTAQSDLLTANLASGIDKQSEALKTAQAELANLVKASEDAASKPGFLARLSSGLAAEAGGAADALPKADTNSTTAILAADLQKQYDAFKAGASNVDAMRISFELLKESQNVNVEEAQKLGAQFVDQATVVRQAEDAHKLLIAQYEVFHNRATQEQIDLVNNAKAMSDAAAAAGAYRKALVDLDFKANLSEDPRLRAQQQAVHSVDPFGTLSPQQSTELAVKAGADYDNEQARKGREALAKVDADLAGKEAVLAESTDKVRAAGDKAAAAARASLTIDGQLAAGADQRIARARNDAEAEQRRQDAISASNKAATEAATQAKYVASVHEGLAAAQQALTDAQRGGTAATREAIATRQAEVEVAGRQIALSSSLGQKLVEEKTQTILLNQAAQDRLTFEKQLQALQDRGADTGVLGRDAGGAVLSDAALQGFDSATLKQVEDRAAAVKKAVDSIPPSLREGEEGVQNVARETSAAIGRFNADLAQSQSNAATNLAAQSRQEAQYAQLRLVAEQQQTPVREQMLAQLAAENELLAKGITLEQIRYDPKYIQDYAQLTHDNLVKTQEDEAKALEARKQQLTDEVVLQPFKDLASLIGKSMTDGLEQFETTGLKGLGASLTSFATSARNIGNTFASNFITLPLNKAIADFADNLTAKGGTLSSAFTQLFKDNPGLASFGVGAGIGGVGGAIGQQISGNPNTAVGGTFGGIAGGVAGGAIGSVFPVVGTAAGAFIGAAIGTAIGSFVGGFFGGGTTGKNNDAQGFSYDPVTGSYTKTDRQGSAQNAQAARGLTEQAAGALDILRAAGLGGQTDAFQFKVGNVSGTEYNGQKYASNQDAMQAAIRDLIDNSVGTITDTLKTVLANTKAEDAAHLQQDIAFAGQYDQLTHRTGAYGQALSDLDTQYRTAEVQAGKLGLSTADLAKALADAEGELKAKFVQQVKVLIGDSGAAGQAIFDLRAQFKAANDDAAKLGFTTGQLADAEARQEAKLRERYHDQAESLIGAFDPVGEAILRVRDNFDQARAIFLDLGESVQGLAEKEAAAEAKAAADAEDQARQQLQGQGQQIRSLIDGLVDPLKQALSGLGPLAGYVAPQQALSSGLAEFRATYRSAANDDTQAIQALPQEAQQLLQLARQYGGSGPQFAAIFKEVQGDLARVLTAQQDRGDQIMASIPDAIRLTGQQQIDTLVRGFGDLRDKLDSVERTIRLLQPGRLGQAA